MLPVVRTIAKRGVFNPVGRAALFTWLWNHRHEITRWGRSLWNEVFGSARVDPVRALRTAKVLAAIAGDDRLRNATELSQVTMKGDVVDLQVQPGWDELPRLLDKVRAVKGVAGVTVNGVDVTEVTSS